MQDVEYVAITTSSKNKWSAGQKRSSNLREMQFLFDDNDSHTSSSLLTVIINVNNMHNRLLDKLRYLLISNGLKIFLVAIFIFLLIKKYLTNHLTIIEEYLNNLSFDDSKQKIVLDKNKKHV